MLFGRKGEPMAPHDHIDRNIAKMKNTNPVVSADQNEPLKVQKDILIDLYEEHRTHARHTESLKSTVISTLIVASAALITLATFDDKLNSWDVPVALLLVGFGFLGTFFSFYHSEKIWKHKERAKGYWKALDRSVVVPFGGHKLRDIREKADKKHPAYSDKPTNFLGRVVKWVEDRETSFLLWTVLPLFISAIGFLLLGLILLDWLLE
jgi:hypothetical protein